MKVEKRNPAHWLLLAGFWLQAAFGVALRPFLRSRNGTIVLYGHKLNGNLLALYRYVQANPDAGLRPVYLSMDRDYLRKLRAQGIDCRWACDPACAGLLASAEALVSDHGLHTLGLWRAVYRSLGLRFFDVWHGIPFKGFDAGDFRVQRRYDEAWVASPAMRKLWVERFGFDPERVIATGYARTDRLVRRDASPSDARRSLELPVDRRAVLFAPTWRQDDHGRSLYPFGCGEAEFIGALADACARHDTTLLVRTHLNSGDIAGTAATDRVAFLPSARYSDTEAILLASDVLLCDWSSIAFDFLLLDRPTLFLDVEPPFRKGFSLGPEYRFGEVVTGMDGLRAALNRYLGDPGAYADEHGAGAAKVREAVYGDCADGQAAARCIARLRTGLGETRV